MIQSDVSGTHGGFVDAPNTGYVNSYADAGASQAAHGAYGVPYGGGSSSYDSYNPASQVAPGFYGMPYGGGSSAYDTGTTSASYSPAPQYAPAYGSGGPGLDGGGAAAPSQPYQGLSVQREDFPHGAIAGSSFGVEQLQANGDLASAKVFIQNARKPANFMPVNQDKARRFYGLDIGAPAGIS